MLEKKENFDKDGKCLHVCFRKNRPLVVLLLSFFIGHKFLKTYVHFPYFIKMHYTF